jgi:hypothetical protein
MVHGEQDRRVMLRSLRFAITTKHEVVVLGTFSFFLRVLRDLRGETNFDYPFGNGT